MFSRIKTIITKQWLLSFTLLFSCLLHGQVLARGQGEQLESAALSSLVKHAVLPSLQQLSHTAHIMRRDVNQLCQQPNEANLMQARESWKAAYMSWRHATPFMFGPADRLQRHIGQWPVEGVILDGILRSEELKSMRKNADVRGYAGVEFILFNYHNAQQVTANTNCEHLIDISNEIVTRVDHAQQQWQTDFAPTFLAAGDGQPFLLPNDALTLAYAEPLNLLERMLWNRIGLPSGFFNAPTKPQMLEAWRSRTSRQAMLASLEGLQLALNPEENSIINLIATKDGLVMKHDPKLANEINRQLAKCTKQLKQMDAPLFDSLKQDDTLLQGLYQDLHQLQQLLSDASLVLELNVRSFDENHVD